MVYDNTAWSSEFHAVFARDYAAAFGGGAGRVDSHHVGDQPEAPTCRRC